jgi:hypothetical protein
VNGSQESLDKFQMVIHCSVLNVVLTTGIGLQLKNKQETISNKIFFAIEKSFFIICIFPSISVVFLHHGKSVENYFYFPLIQIQYSNVLFFIILLFLKLQNCSIYSQNHSNVELMLCIFLFRYNKSIAFVLRIEQNYGRVWCIAG